MYRRRRRKKKKKKKIERNKEKGEKIVRVRGGEEGVQKNKKGKKQTAIVILGLMTLSVRGYTRL